MNEITDRMKKYLFFLSAVSMAMFTACSSGDDLAAAPELTQAEKDAIAAAKQAEREAAAAEREKERESAKKRRTFNTIGGAAAGTVGREVGNTLGSAVGGKLGKKVGGNVGASLGRGILKSLLGL